MIDTVNKECVLYTRVSSVAQTKRGDGLGSQQTRCREFARLKNFEVVKVFQDDVSGARTDRPGILSMLEFLREHPGTFVVVDDISRIARGLSAHLEIRAAIAEVGGKLVSPSIEFGDDPDSLLVENLMATVSQHQRQKNREQTINRMQARVRAGYWVFQAPVGYKYQRVSGRGNMLVPDEPVASVVREAFEKFETEIFTTQAEVMRNLQDNPLFPKDKSGVVRHQRVKDLLTQCAYAGYIESKTWGNPLRCQ